jgi:hypothetical protein
MDSATGETSGGGAAGRRTLAPLWCVHHAGVQLEQVRAATALAARRIVARNRGLPFVAIGAVQVGPKVVLFPPRPTG